MELAGSNVVVTANQFNPTIVTQLWLVKNKIVGDDEFEPACAYAENVSKTETKRFQLIVLPHMLQFALKAGEHDEAVITREVVGKLVKTLPHTPYAAVGLNFYWMVEPGQAGITTQSRRLFCVSERAPYKFFHAADARFGAYMSRDFELFRLKLDIKPVKRADNSDESALMFSFNYNCDLSGENILDTIESALAKWDLAKEDARHTVAATVGDGT